MWFELWYYYDVLTTRIMTGGIAAGVLYHIGKAIYNAV